MPVDPLLEHTKVRHTLLASFAVPPQTQNPVWSLYTEWNHGGIGEDNEQTLLEIQKLRREKREEKQFKPITCNLQPYQGGDIEEFFMWLERSMQLHKIEEDEWSLHFVLLLTGKAMAAWNITAEDTAYDKIKQSILERFERNWEVQRQKLREMFWKEGDEPGEVYTHVRMLLQRWLGHWEVAC